MKIENEPAPIQPLQNEQYNKQMLSAEDNTAKNNNNMAPPDEKSVNSDQADNIVSQINELMKPIRTNLKFELHEKLDDYYVKVIDRETKEVIKEIPPEKMLDMYAAMAEFMGFLTDEKV
ncbi:flagellar protein FlaG [Lentibacillus sp.]|uniref:flagellar protein FlaG n=1 Tax=Lentibacillus sp. TaxID=1925746 RepID=UPI002B4B8D28|nr:flagellar protein FlaG [Lentibacillus sp.]HLS09727.1 flagellar protein FlaG [Lentibacillus sp.]